MPRLWSALTSAIGSGQTLICFDMTWGQLWSHFGESKNVLHVKTFPVSRHNERGVGTDGSSLPIGHCEFVNNANIWDKCLLRVLVSRGGESDLETWRESKDRLFFNLSNYPQTCWVKHNPHRLENGIRVRRFDNGGFERCFVNQHFYPKAVWNDLVRKSVFSIWQERCSTITHFRYISFLLSGRYRRLLTVNRITSSSAGNLSQTAESWDDVHHAEAASTL